jgi:peptidoglycan/xylan/chitin deacetylase (PgdA/CDA1 family)
LAAKKKAAAKRPARKQAARWNEPQRRGNPFGALLVLAGVAGLLYAACAPKRQAPTAPAAPSAAATEAAPVAPRARHDPPPRVTVTEAPSPQTAETKAPARAEPPAKPARSIETVEPTVRLAPPEAPKPVPRGEFERNPAASGTVALTFDGCYDDKPLPGILKALDHHGFKATFFIAGRFAQRYPSSVRRIADDGMELGNHSWNHPHFTRLTDAQIESQLSRTNALIEGLTGKKPNLFRPPFGDRDDRVRRLAGQAGYTTVCWALDSWDSVKVGITPDEISQRVLARVKPGEVVLLHIGSQATADALEPILQGLDARGLRVVPVSELMAS